MRNLGLLGLRLTVGGYLAVHGAQKLFGAFGGYGLDGTGRFFETIGLKPGRQLATLAGACEFGGGILTATGVAHPVGPLAAAGSMAVATAVHYPKGPLSAKGGYELPATNLAALTAIALAPAGPFRLGPKLPRKLSLVATATAVGVAGVLIRNVLEAQRTQAAAVAAAESTPEPLATAAS
jgi:putative oxidoreductase